MKDAFGVSKGLPSALRGKAISYESKGVGPSWARNKIRRTMDGKKYGSPDMTSDFHRSRVFGAKATKTRSNTLLNTGGKLASTKGRVLP